jgi:hypothetical protein
MTPEDLRDLRPKALAAKYGIAIQTASEHRIRAGYRCRPPKYEYRNPPHRSPKSMDEVDAILVKLLERNRTMAELVEGTGEHRSRLYRALGRVGAVQRGRCWRLPKENG